MKILDLEKGVSSFRVVKKISFSVKTIDLFCEKPMISHRNAKKKVYAYIC